MSERTGYLPGVPCWADLSTTDVKGGAAFYGEMLGWDVEFDDRPESGGYGQFLLRGRRVAGIGPTFEESDPAWNTYFATRDAAGTAAKVGACGGAVVMEPMPIFDQGVMAVFQDPSGAFFSVWQAGRHIGAELINEPGTLCWHELATRDVDAAGDFYTKIFGWQPRTSDMGGAPYTEFLADDHSIAGAMPMTAVHPPEAPPHWLVYFCVADADAVTAHAERIGATVLAPPRSVPSGRFSVLADPQSAPFAVIALPETPPETHPEASRPRG